MTDDIRHQFFSLCLDLKENAMNLADGDDEAEIRYAAADLDHDQHVELIVENIAKGSFRLNKTMYYY